MLFYVSDMHLMHLETSAFGSINIFEILQAKCSSRNNTAHMPDSICISSVFDKP